jgi:DNA polymerase-3 subunit delta'
VSENQAALPPWLDAPLASLLAMRASLPHALLLQGPRGIGKALLAERFAQCLLCEAPLPDGQACGSCDACGWFRAANHPDFRRVSPLVDEEGSGKSERSRREIKIDQIRALGDFVGIGAHRAGRKLVLIDPADAMNMPAANALLKTLEEPSGDTVFLLVCGNAGALPATVRSRCVPFKLVTPDAAQAQAWLHSALAGDPALIGQWLALADGAPLRARDFAEPAASAAYRMVLQAGADIPENPVMKSAEGLATVPAALWVPLLQAWIGDLARVCVQAAPVRFPAQAPRVRALAKRTSLGRIMGLAQWLNRQTPILEHPLNARLLAEDVWLRYEALFSGA